MRWIAFIEIENVNVNDIFYINKHRETLPKALRTQVLTALSINFGLEGLVWQVWFCRFGLVGLAWHVGFGRFGLVGLVW